jgi:hypothetical protein
MMRKGEIVNIYLDPITKQDYEGKAKLVKRLQTDNFPYREQWQVQFPDDDGMKVNRWLCEDPAITFKG